MDQALHVAIITNEAFRAENITAAAQQAGWHCSACVGSNLPREWLRHRQVDVALLDLDVPDALMQLRDVAHGVPNVPLLALVTPQHLVELQEALTSGASGFVAFPLESNQFTTAVLKTVQDNAHRATQRRGRVVAVTSLKGGIGRSTLAVNMAVALRQRTDKEVVLVEAHQGLGDLSLMLNLIPRHTVASLAQEATIDADLLQGHLMHHNSRIQLLAAPADMEQLVELPIETWRHILHLLTELAAYVILDTGMMADPLLSEILTQADDIVVVTGPDLASLRSAVVLLRSLDDEPNVHGRMHVVLNRAGLRGGVTEAASRAQVGEEITAAIADDPALTTFAINRGVPFVMSHPRAIISKEIYALVDRIFEFAPTGKSKGKESKPRARFSLRKRTPAAAGAD
jgi:pilus assembly protein CpaE